MKQAVSQLEVRGALRQNLMQDTSIVQQDYDADAHVLIIRAELSIATLTGTLGSLKALQAQGVTTIALVTQHCTSTLDLAELTALGGEDTVFSLVHTAGIPALSVGGALHDELDPLNLTKRPSQPKHSCSGLRGPFFLFQSLFQIIPQRRAGQQAPARAAQAPVRRSASRTRSLPAGRLPPD